MISSPLPLQIGIAIFLLVALPLVHRAFKRSDACRLAIARLQASSQVSRELGRPLSFGWASGEIEACSSGSGEANLSFRVRGSNHRGTVFVEALRERHEWRLTSVMLQLQVRCGASKSAVDQRTTTKWLFPHSCLLKQNPRNHKGLALPQSSCKV